MNGFAYANPTDFPQRGKPRGKAELAAEYPTWEAYRAHQREDRKRLEAEGWKFASPGSTAEESV